MQNSILISDAQVRPAGISVEEGINADCFMECNTFAVYWRPIEEMSEK